MTEMIEGRNAVLEAFRSGKCVDKLFILDGCQDGPVRTIAREARKHDTIVKFVPKERLDSMSETGAHQGVIAQVAAYDYSTVEDILKKAEEKADILTGMIVCTMRNLETEKNIAMLKEAREFLGNGVVACDLAGDEKAYPTAAFADVFATAKKYGMPYTIHAGECGSREEIRTAIELGTSRIGHGIAMSGDEELKKEVAEKKIGVELCPTSNLQTKAVTDFTDYPFREFYDAGILLSINTDNRTVSDTSCTDEYMRLAEAGMFQEPMCEKIYMASLHSAFADDDTKQVLWKKWMSMFDL